MKGQIPVRVLVHHQSPDRALDLQWPALDRVAEMHSFLKSSSEWAPILRMHLPAWRSCQRQSTDHQRRQSPRQLTFFTRQIGPTLIVTVHNPTSRAMTQRTRATRTKRYSCQRINCPWWSQPFQRFCQMQNQAIVPDTGNVENLMPEAGPCVNQSWIQAQTGQITGLNSSPPPQPGKTRLNVGGDPKNTSDALHVLGNSSAQVSKMKIEEKDP